MDMAVIVIHISGQIVQRRASGAGFVAGVHDMGACLRAFGLLPCLAAVAIYGSRREDFLLVRSAALSAAIAARTHHEHGNHSNDSHGTGHNKAGNQASVAALVAGGRGRLSIGGAGLGTACAVDVLENGKGGGAQQRWKVAPGDHGLDPLLDDRGL